jgi:hypothetical protein
MSDIKDFAHLPLPLREYGKPHYQVPKISRSSETEQNRQNRQSHGNKLKNSAAMLSRFWQDRRNTRIQQNLPTIDGGIPFLLEIDPKTNVDFLRGLGFEIVCDLADGFIVVSSEDTNLSKFIKKVNVFIQGKNRSGSPAKVYALCDDRDRLQRILSPSLFNSWAAIDEKKIYIVDVSIECCGLGTTPNLPNKREGETDRDYELRGDNARITFLNKIDEAARIRQQQFENIVKAYNGILLSSYIEVTDSFTVRISINGAGLKDLVNYAYIFEVSEFIEIQVESATARVQDVGDDLTIIAPMQDSPIVCVIDSGIQENHKYLSQAIIQSDSVCFIPDQTNTNDDVSYGGHGTRVAGAILYPRAIPISGTYQLPCFIRNVKVLDHNSMPMSLKPEDVISEIVTKFTSDVYEKSKIFNHSIGERRPFDELKHMTSWAAKIDAVSDENDVIFILAAGNMATDVIKAHIQAGHEYPHYLGRELSRISDPAQSLQALTVGSISHSDYEDADRTAMGKSGEISSFSRVGPGIWDSIKPDVVEYGGTHIINKTGSDVILTTSEEVCTELLRRSPEGPAFSKDDIGTSFAAPKVAYIAAEIQKILPFAPALLYRALIAQSARWPNEKVSRTPDQCQMLLRQMGYGLPDVIKATQNNDYRVTLITTDTMEVGDGEAHIYIINVPQELRNVGEDYNVLLEITLSYSAKPRRTRRHVEGYLSTWLDWTCSKKGETPEAFRRRIFETGVAVEDEGNFDWIIHERDNYGIIKNFRRKKQTLQKDWCVLKSSQLSEAFCIAVRGHKGWGSLFKAKYSLAVSFEAIDQNIEIYEAIRVNNIIETEVDNQEINVELDYGNIDV